MTKNTLIILTFVFLLLQASAATYLIVESEQAEPDIQSCKWAFAAWAVFSLLNFAAAQYYVNHSKPTDDELS